MLTNLQLDNNARWKQHFRVSVVLWTQIAPANPERGLVINNTSGKYQLYTWDVSSSVLWQLTERPTGILYGELSGDGRYVYYLDDKQGDQIGHFIRIPFESGKAQDLTPDLPPYSSFTFASSGSGSHFGFMAADVEGFHIYSLEMKANGDLGAPRQLFHSRKMASGPTYSYEGEIALVLTSDRSTVQHYNLLAFYTASCAQIAEMWDGSGTSLLPMGFSARPGDLRLAGTTNCSGVKPPYI